MWLNPLLNTYILFMVLAAMKFSRKLHVVKIDLICYHKVCKIVIFIESSRHLFYSLEIESIV